jgi:hypothetical protein
MIARTADQYRGALAPGVHDLVFNRYLLLIDLKWRQSSAILFTVGPS